MKKPTRKELKQLCLSILAKNYKKNGKTLKYTELQSKLKRIYDLEIPSRRAQQYKTEFAKQNKEKHPKTSFADHTYKQLSINPNISYVYIISSYVSGCCYRHTELFLLGEINKCRRSLGLSNQEPRPESKNGVKSPAIGSVRFLKYQLFSEYYLINKCLGYNHAKMLTGMSGHSLRNLIHQWRVYNDIPTLKSDELSNICQDRFKQFAEKNIELNYEELKGKYLKMRRKGQIADPSNIKNLQRIHSQIIIQKPKPQD